MSRKLFVGGISWDTTDSDLATAFSPHGSVVSAKVIMDRDTGNSRGFGFVEFENAESAKSARENMDGTELDGRIVRVDLAKEQERPSHGGGHNRGGDRDDKSSGQNKRGGRDSYNR